MKKLIAFITIGSFILLNACGNRNAEAPTDLINNPNSATGRQNDNLPRMEFTTNIHDFGRVTEGEKLTYSFKFKNTGKSNLIIVSADASCGCTVPAFPTKPIAPGAEDYITVTFNSTGKLGFNDKTVTVVSNCQPNSTLLRIKAQVDPAAAQE